MNNHLQKDRMRAVALPDVTIELPPLLCADAGVYALVHVCGAAVTDSGMRFDKRFKAAHRLAIADTRGRLELTVPVAKPASHDCRWSDVAVSPHGEWWDVHRVALESAYGRTPYFEFYIDRFRPMLTAGVIGRFPKITDLSAAWDREIRRILCLPPAMDGGAGTTDRITIDPGALPAFDMPPHYQVRSGKLGFIAGLSVLDLIFNLGPEATLYLDKLETQAVEFLTDRAARSRERSKT